MGQGYIFRSMCQEFCPLGGQAGGGGMHGGGVHGRGACLAEGRVWQGVCMAGGHAWQGA